MERRGLTLSVSASRHGITEAQLRCFRALVGLWAPIALVHGDCKGGDAQLHYEARRMGLWCECYPSNFDFWRAHTDAVRLDIPRYPTDRDEQIVRRGHAHAAFPQRDSRGTWFTARIAAELGRPVVVVQPDGQVAHGWA